MQLQATSVQRELIGRHKEQARLEQEQMKT